MKKTTTKIRVRYAETDQMGFVHHGNYAQFFEMGRLDWITKIGISYKNMESKGILLPVVFLKTNYLKPAYYDDELTIETSLLEKPTAKIKFGYKIYNENKDIITEGITHLAFMNKQSGKPQRCPNIFWIKFKLIVTICN